MLERAEQGLLLQVRLLGLGGEFRLLHHVAHIDPDLVDVERGLLFVFAAGSIVECLHRELVRLLLHEDGRGQLICPGLIG